LGIEIPMLETEKLVLRGHMIRSFAAYQPDALPQSAAHFKPEFMQKKNPGSFPPGFPRITA
jgi:hypothetical protein